MSTKTKSILENLRLALHGVLAPFSCEGTCVPKAPVTFVFRDRTRFTLTRARDQFDQTNLLKPLLDHCKPASFGDGKRTRYDRSVRDAVQLNAEEGVFSIEGFDPESAGILKKIQRELVPHDPNPISAELYAVNVYSRGGHFAPHKDTPRGAGMFGTLVVCLPSQFYRGRLILSHHGIVKEYEWGSAIAKQKKPHQLHWAAFFGDVDHQIEQIWGGARVTLTYLLRRGENEEPAPDISQADLAPRIQEAWQALLADESFLPDGGTLGYPCCHLYHQDARFQIQRQPLDARSATMLKGRDYLAAATAIQAGLNVSFAPYMFEDCADETWQLDRFPTSKEKSQLDWQLDSCALERALPIHARSENAGGFGVDWLDPPPSSDRSIWQSREEGDPDLPAAAKLHTGDYCPWGYFGNESSEVDFYVFAALHIAIPKFSRGKRIAAKPAIRTTRLRRQFTRKQSARKRNDP